MHLGVTTVGNGWSELRIYVHADRDESGDFLGTVMIQQGRWGEFHDSIAVADPKVAQSLIKIINVFRYAEVWAKDRVERTCIGGEGGAEIYISTREDVGNYNAGFLIEQLPHEKNHNTGGMIFVDSPYHAQNLSRAIVRRWNEHGFGWD